MTPEWQMIATESYGNEWSEPTREKVCIVATRYGGCYEGGRFAALPLSALDSAAFGQDLAAAAWWDANKEQVGIGKTPNDALMDWAKKRVLCGA